jgi:hypothetical protein
MHTPQRLREISLVVILLTLHGCAAPVLVPPSSESNVPLSEARSAATLYEIERIAMTKRGVDGMTVIEFQMDRSVCTRSSPSWARVCSQPVTPEAQWLAIGDRYAVEPCFLDAGVLWCWSAQTGSEPQRVYEDVRLIAEGGARRLRAFSTDDGRFCIVRDSGELRSIESLAEGLEIGSESHFACERYQDSAQCIDDEAQVAFWSRGSVIRRSRRWERGFACVAFPSGLHVGTGRFACSDHGPTRRCEADSDPAILHCVGSEYGRPLSEDVVGGCFLPSGVFGSCDFEGSPTVRARSAVRSVATDSTGESVCVLLDDGVECWGIGPSFEQEGFWWHGATTCPQDTIRCGLDRNWLPEPE